MFGTFGTMFGSNIASGKGSGSATTLEEAIADEECEEGEAASVVFFFFLAGDQVIAPRRTTRSGLIPLAW